MLAHDQRFTSVSAWRSTKMLFDRWCKLKRRTQAGELDRIVRQLILSMKPEIEADPIEAMSLKRFLAGISEEITPDERQELVRLGPPSRE